MPLKYLITKHKCKRIPSRLTFLLATFLLFLPWLSGCRGFWKQYDIYSTGGPVSDKHADETLDGKICVLGARVPTGSEGYQNTASDLLTSVLRKHFAEAEDPSRVVSYAQFLNEINRKGLIGEYMELAEIYQITDLYPKALLRIFHEKLGVRYFIKPALLQLAQSSDVRLSVWGLRLIVTKETNAKVSLEIWDARIGAKVWAGAAGCTIAGEKLSQRRIAPQKAIDDAWRELLEKIFE
ncbi:MAG: hypothetical protein KGZ25_01530 [Planctomycetes bacterium]|nr:hypothetical protein [Planctomycetota bacterium]